MSKHIKLKVPVSNVSNKVDYYNKVIETLKSDPNNAYTTCGVLVTSFGVNEEDIAGKNFAEWTNVSPALYGKVSKILKQLVSEGKAEMNKDSRSYVYHWIA